METRIEAQLAQKLGIGHFFKITATVFVATLTGLLLLEIGLRVFLPQQESMRWFEHSKKYGYLNKKSFHQSYRYIGYDFTMNVQTNSLGHRGKECNATVFNNSEVKKVLLLGDSFVFGYGINLKDHIATHLDALLNTEKVKFSVINAGVGGWGTLQETTYARDHYKLFQPDYIVLFFCGNDPDDDVNFQHNMSDNEKGVFYFPGKIFLRDHSHLYRFLFYKFHVLLH